MIHIVPGCGCPRHTNSKFCRPHHGSWNALELQQEDEDEEAQQMLKDLKEKGSDAERGQAVFNFCLLNPADQKCVKKRFFDLIGYMKQRYTKTENAHREGEKPMTKAAFKCHCEGTLGLPEEEWKEWWDELDNHPKTQRDFKGFRGREQLWVPLGESKERSKVKGVADIVEESSAKQKKYKAKDRQMLIDHLNRQRTSHYDSFLGALDEAPNHSLKKRGTHR